MNTVGFPSGNIHQSAEHNAIGIASGYIGIDEVCLSRGELYTILINKEKTGRSGSIIAIVKGMWKN